MRKIYIDGGAYDGDTIRLFKEGGIVQRDDLEEFEIFAFEPLSELPDIIHKAMGTYDGKVKFAWNRDRPMASTIEKESRLFNTGIVPFHPKDPKLKKNQTEKVEVEIFDFPKWFKKNFTKDDYIILKLDIEGSEFAILEKMIKERTISWVDKLYCEFHSFHMPTYKKREEKIKQKLSELNIKYIDWELYD